jgi:hypothetical protein
LLGSALREQIEREAMERLDRALVDETKRQRSKDGNGKRDGRSS